MVTDSDDIDMSNIRDSHRKLSNENRQYNPKYKLTYDITYRYWVGIKTSLQERHWNSTWFFVF